MPKLIGSLKKLDMVCVSLDGPQEINDITRGEGSFLKGTEALQCLQENNVNRQIRITLQKNNLDCVEEMFQMADKYGACLNFGLLFHQASDDGAKMGLSKDTLSRLDLFTLMLNEPRLIRRPLVIYNGILMLGTDSQMMSSIKQITD